ncbi:MAG: glycosyltransferase [Chlorobiaceae bacterium]|jgi:chlorobactene glucosyltransferase|nr:glycosyltransferase [Chlorobiaceae bacterium]
MMIYQLFILGSLLVFLGIVIKNLADLPELPPAGAEVDACQPTLSILVPARNEELNIPDCVSSLLGQRYPDFEVIVLDDHSTDGTLRELRRLASSPLGDRLRIIEGQPLPAGWHGKAWACQQLAESALGELLLFTDADTKHRPDGLYRAVEAMRRSRADMLSLTPAQELVTFWEKLIVPLVYHILFSYLPLAMVWKSRFPAFCYAIGQFILFRREAYLRIGGHQSVCNNLVEDVWLCKEVKRAGGKVVVFDGTDAVSCRMYRGAEEVWKGFSKNLYAGLGNRFPGLMALLTLVVLLYLAPYGFMVSAIVQNDRSIDLFWLPALQIILALFIRMLIAVKFRQSSGMVLLHSLSQVILLLIAFNSFRLTAFGKGPEWKGRNYSFSRRGASG